MSSPSFGRVLEVLTSGGKARAASEVQFAAGIDMQQAQAWLDNLLSCVYSWPFSDEDQVVLAHIDLVFSSVQKPEHFTNYAHCDECAEHDEVLLRRTRETLQRTDLGNAGWDPLSFCSPEGIAYLFPALARFSLIPDVWTDNDWYIDQFLFHLSYQGPENKFLLWCDADRRAAVYNLLRHLAYSRQELTRDAACDKALSVATSAWQPLNMQFDTDEQSRRST